MADIRDHIEHGLRDSYRIVRELGGGGMSRVFLAEEIALGRLVVVKVLPADLAATVSVDRFRREIRFAAQLQHPHVVPLLSAGEIEGIPYFTMPYVEGESLRGELSRSGEFPVRRAVQVLREVASALAYAHSHGVIHRDIKPENILISGGSAMVTDFGVAKALEASALHSSDDISAAGVATGTPAYMSPEQVAADRSTDHRSDIYAFGLVAYELLTGSSPFAGRPAQAMLAAHMTEMPEPLIRRRNVPSALSLLVMRCLEKRPADRPQTAGEIVEALDTTLYSDESVRSDVAHRSSSPARRTASRYTGPLSAAAVIIAVVGGSLLVSRDKASESPPTKSIAVIPFRNLSAANENEFFSEGMTEEIADALAQVPGLRVAARTSAAAAVAKGLDLRRVGKELGVGSILQGTVQRVGDRARITVQLISVANGFQIWNAKYDNELKDIFAVQDTIARSIVSALRIALAAPAPELVRVATHSPEAHMLYLQGLYLLNRRTAKTIRQSISFFQEAIDKDPQYAQAYGGIAIAYVALPYYADLPTADTLAKATDAAARSIELDSTTVEPYAALGMAESMMWRNASAERAFRRALQLDSTFATGRQWNALRLSHLARHDEAVSEIRRAQQLDPQALIISTLAGQVLSAARRNEEAEAVIRRTLQIDSSFLLAYRSLTEVLIAGAKYQAAIAAAKRSLELSGTRPSFDVALLLKAYVMAERSTDARPLLAELDARSRNSRVSALGMAIAYDALGNREHSVRWLARAVTDPDPMLHAYSHSALLDHLRSDPRGAALLASTEAANDQTPRREAPR
jgi:serine/threonine-protein kinase